jgi:hypothetical protein
MYVNHLERYSVGISKIMQETNSEMMNKFVNNN